MMQNLNIQNNSFLKNDDLKARRIKLLICGILLFSAFLTISYRTISLANVDNRKKTSISFKDIKSKSSEHFIRGNIFDRNNNLLATTVNVSRLNINPQEILDINETILKLIKVFPNLNKNELLQKLNSDKKHINLLREISPKDHVSLLELGIEALKIENSNKRIYPNHSLASHVLGSTDIDGKGIAGIEKKFNKQLKNGEDISISIHSGIQHITKTLLLKQITKYSAEGGAGIIMNAKNGEIYALVSLPDYNANNYRKVFDKKLFNKATKGTYELGSTLKLITAAVALESELINEHEVFDVSSPLRISSKTISDYHPLSYSINIPEVVVHSSNIGSAKIAEKFGPYTQLKYLKSLGLMDKLSLELPELGRPQVRTDKKLLTTMTISYGHGISITPTHLASATATIVNDGLKVNPTLLTSKTYKTNDRIFSTKTSKTMRSIMRLVVSNKNGTAKQAEASGYLVGGKTGTAEKVNPAGGYFKKQNIVTLTSAFPMNDPKFVITIMIDNPKGKRRTAGWVVAPVVNKIVTRIAPILGVKPLTQNSISFSKNLLKYKIRGKDKGANL
ncbi:penicillin-binding protein 2 [Alphaproteobacteria bacterium]|nr:penicillin-binding protein 2 [Alphaproteobacteria bacterium]